MLSSSREACHLVGLVTIQLRLLGLAALALLSEALHPLLAMQESRIPSSQTSIVATSGGMSHRTDLVGQKSGPKTRGTATTTRSQESCSR